MDQSLPSGAKERKDIPVYSGVLKYFPRAIAYIAHVSKVGNDQHNPGEPLHWAKDKSTDHLDSCVRHLMDAGKTDKDGVLHSGKAAWRALANLETELEKESLKGDELSRILNQYIEEEASKPVKMSPVWKKILGVDSSPRRQKGLVIYVAGPYRDKDPDVVRDNISRADYWGRRLRKMGHYPIVPHTMTQSWDGEFTFEQIMEADLALLSRCDGLLYLGLSEGTLKEHDHAKKLGMRLFYPHMLPPNLTGVD